MAEYRIAAVGDKNSVLGFRAVGFDVHFAEEANEAEHLIRKLCKSGEYAVIFVTEPLLEELAKPLAEFRDRTLPAILSIPAVSGSTGLGITQIKKSVERAVGADILFKE